MNGAQRIRVLIVADTVDGGAGKACVRLHSALHGQADLDVNLAVTTAGNRVVDYIQITSEWPCLSGIMLNRLSYRAERWLPNGLRRFVYRMRSRGFEDDMLRVIRKARPDVVNIHNFHGLSFQFLERIPRHLPIVLTLHDMWPLTGYCVYSFACRKFVEGCTGVCPEWSKWGESWLSPSVAWERRTRFFDANRHRTVLVSPSRWLAELAQARFGGRLRVECIPNSVPTEVFKPVDRQLARSVLGLPEDSVILLVGAGGLNEARKGMALLPAVVERVKLDCAADVRVVAFGAASGLDAPPNWLRVGRIRDDVLLNLYYNAADVYLLPSWADNLPNTLLEAAAAGVPSVTSDVGGCAETLCADACGVAVRQRDAESFSHAILSLINIGTEEKASRRRACRAAAMAAFSADVQAARYRQVLIEAGQPR